MSAIDRLDEIEARANAATEGPWVTGGTDLAGEVYFGTYADPDDPTEPGVMLGVTGTQEDAALIAHARTDVPALVAALRAVLDLADRWAAQSTDYDEDTEQQIDDGKAIVRAIEEALS